MPRDWTIELDCDGANLFGGDLEPIQYDKALFLESDARFNWGEFDAEYDRALQIDQEMNWFETGISPVLNHAIELEAQTGFRFSGDTRLRLGVSYSFETQVPPLTLNTEHLFFDRDNTLENDYDYPGTQMETFADRMIEGTGGGGETFNGDCLQLMRGVLPMAPSGEIFILTQNGREPLADARIKRGQTVILQLVVRGKDLEACLDRSWGWFLHFLIKADPTHDTESAWTHKSSSVNPGGINIQSVSDTVSQIGGSLDELIAQIPLTPTDTNQVSVTSKVYYEAWLEQEGMGESYPLVEGAFIYLYSGGNP